jgi:hypothetical protein
MFLPFSERGKRWEPVGLRLRRLAGVRLTDRLDPWLLAKKVGLTIVDAGPFLECLPKDERQQLTSDGRCWSGGIFPVALPDGTHLCMLNPRHSRLRQKVTLMEEISHTHLQHVPSRLTHSSPGLRVRDVDPDQEADAYGIGAAALLPWPTFFPAVKDGQTIEELALGYDVSEDLILYRIKITGAYHLYQSRQRRA